jgi:hypothetical protein
VFQGLEPDTLAGWSDYRAAVGEYYFRLFDPSGQLRALVEFDAAIRFNPANTRAATLRRRLIQQQTPGGVARDLDIAPDVKDLSVGLLGETQLVLAQFLAVLETATQLEIAAATKDQLGLVVHQLRDRMNEAQLNVISARSGVQAATANRNMYDDQVTGLEGQMLALDHAPLSLGDQLMTLGALATAVAGLATGGGEIVSIAGAIAAMNPELGLTAVLNGEDFTDEKKFNDSVKKLREGGRDAVISLNTVYEKLSGSSSDEKIAQLAMQEVNVRRQLMVANLRLQQAQDQLHAAEARVVDYGAEVQAAQGLLDNWSVTESFLNGALGVLLNVARRLVDMVSEDIFLARRALEIYQLEDASTVHFDYGLLHPDRDNDLVLQPLTRAQLSLQSVSTMPADVITWNKIFVQLNEAQTSGFDVVHPSIEVVIDDPAALAQLKQGGGMKFSVGIGPTPASATIPTGVFELKVNTLTLDLVGASATGAAILWVQHSGHWLMARRLNPAAPNPPAIEFMLLPHVEAFNFQAGSSVLSAAIPAQPPSTAQPGPPFSFWGRGALADWTLFPDPSARTLNLGALNSVRFVIGCIGLVPPGAVVPPVFSVKPQPVPVTPGAVVTLARQAGSARPARA